MKILCRDEAQILELDKELWNIGRISFLPHATYKDPKCELQPILLTCDLEANLNNASILINLSDHSTDYQNYKKILFIFDGNNPLELEHARTRWKELTEAKFKLNYFKQDNKGNWLQNE